MTKEELIAWAEADGYVDMRQLLTALADPEFEARAGEGRRVGAYAWLQRKMEQGWFAKPQPGTGSFWMDTLGNVWVIPFANHSVFAENIIGVHGTSFLEAAGWIHASTDYVGKEDNARAQVYMHPATRGQNVTIEKEFAGRVTVIVNPHWDDYLAERMGGIGPAREAEKRFRRVKRELRLAEKADA